MKTRLEILEKEMKEKDVEIKALRKKVDQAENDIKSLRNEFTETLEKITKAAFEKITETLVKVMTQKQDAMEERNNVQFNTLHKQLSMFSNLIQPSANVPDDCQQYPRSSQNQCDDCGKSFGSSRALMNHVRNDHKPKS